MIAGGTKAPLAPIVALSGGREETITTPVPLEGAATRLANLIAQQYVVEYSLNGRADQFRIGVARPSVSVAAPGWVLR
jgi:hypothetical protein